MNLQVKSQSVESIRTTKYDLILTCIGYESRARYWWEHYGATGIHKRAFAFNEHQELSFADNYSVFQSAGFQIVDISRGNIVDSVSILEWLAQIDSREEGLSVAIDISSMSRFLISCLCFELWALARKISIPIRTDFVYSPAVFGEKPSMTGPIVVNGPVISNLGGWPKIPGTPCGLLLGVGYEEDLALGMVEELEPTSVWAFRPKDHDERYDIAIDDANQGLFQEIPPSNLIRYSVFDPVSLYFSIEALLALAKTDYAMIVLPFGPKIFALASILGAMQHYPEVGLWRVSGGANLKPVDRKALGEIIALQCTFLPSFNS